MKKLSLTFDDGPNPQCTPEILDVLARHDVPATFFTIGKYVHVHPELVKRAETEGHMCENHTWSHRDVRGMDWHELESEIGGWGNYFRPPGGRYDEGVLSYLELYKIQMVMWDFDGFDYIHGRTADQIVQTLDEQIQDTDDGIILLHDGDSENSVGDRRATVEATDRIIAKYKAEGYEFVPLSEMQLPGTPRKTSL